MIPSDKCYDIIKHHEYCELKAYKDIAGVWTIGWGTTRYENGAPVKEGQIIPQWKADDLLKYWVDDTAKSVQHLTINIRLLQHQFDALVSFAYNEGSGALSHSTLLDKIKLNPNDPYIRRAFEMWCKAHVNGELVTVPSLLARRKSESWLYFHNELKYFHE